MKIKFTAFVLIISFVILSLTLQAKEENLLDPLTNLKTDSTEVEKRRIPLLIAFTAEHCPFCMTVKEEFLHPMKRGGLYTDKVIMREADFDSDTDVITIDGNTMSTSEFGHLYGVNVTPTLIFIDQEGKEIAKRLIGISTVDYYGGFLDEAIDESIEELNARNK